MRHILILLALGGLCFSQDGTTAPKDLSVHVFLDGFDRGGSSVGLRESPVKSVGGTVVVAAALSNGLILAADSRLTATFGGGTEPSYKIGSDSSNKVFSIGKTGIAVFGEAFLLDRSIESFIQEYKLKAVTGDVHDIAKGFAEYIGPFYDQHVAAKKNAPILGFVFAGYDKGGVGRLVEIDFPDKRTPKDLLQ
jgi:20S proteasome alpha/beta subunit